MRTPDSSMSTVECPSQVIVVPVMAPAASQRPSPARVRGPRS